MESWTGRPLDFFGRASRSRHWRNSSRTVVGAAAFTLLALWMAGTSTVYAQGGQTPISAPISTHVIGALPTLTVRLSRSVYRIHVDPKSGAPVMPADVVAWVSVEGWPADIPMPQSYSWHVFLDWGGKPVATHHSISDLKFERPSPFPISLSGQVRGGRLKVIAKTTIEGREVIGYALADVLGDNPPRSTVLRAFPPNRVGLIASKIAMAESGMRQFNPVDGMPMVSRTNDFGMMQLNAPTGAITSADQVWDWRANLRRGLEMLDDKRRTTILASRGVGRQQDPRELVTGYEDAACLNILRWYLGMPLAAPPVAPSLSVQHGSGILPGESDPDHLALSQIERDAIRRYNGGREYALALVTDPETLTIKGAEWQVDPTRGGIRARSGDPDYVEHVLRARSGFVIPVAAPPSKSKHRRVHRRRH